MATFDEFISSIRNEFGEQDAGKKFETFCKWFLENDPEWSKTVDVEGHCGVVKSFTLDGYRLGQWVSKQRGAKDRMSPERRQRLDAIGFIWNASKDKT